jgi:hypothetical protein
MIIIMIICCQVAVHWPQSVAVALRCGRQLCVPGDYSCLWHTSTAAAVRHFCVHCLQFALLLHKLVSQACQNRAARE